MRLLLVVGALYGCSEGRATVPPILRLAEEIRIDLPDDFPVAGAEASVAGRLVLWSTANPALITVDVSRAVRRVSLGKYRKILAAAFVAGDSLVEVVDRAERTVLRATFDGRLVRSSPLPQGLVPITARRVAGSWVVVGTRDSGTTLEMVNLTQPHVALGPLHFAGVQSGARFHMAGSMDRIIIGQEDPPFRVASFGLSGDVVVFDTPTLRGIRARDTTTAKRNWWVALPVIPFEAGSIQVIADIRSDSRIIVVRDSSGAVRRTSHTALPIGLLDAPMGTHLIYAIARRPSHQLIRYQWALIQR